ncbi:MAG: hypothetical protein KKA64_03565 [Nanoarchaeota archaeon]|nr:hypothetical protein [Nanoarchaeota archaeon]
MVKTKKPVPKKEAKRIEITDKEFEEKTIELAKTGLTSEKIGEKLRKEGIHPQEYKKKISIILKENNLYASPDMKNISDRLERIRKHYEKHKQDKRSKREVDRVFAQLRKAKKYFRI